MAMSFSEFCTKCNYEIEKERVTMADIDPEGVKNRKSLREMELERIRSYVPELNLRDSTMFIKIELGDPGFIVKSPADWSYIFGGAKRGVWIVADIESILGNVLYVVSRGKGVDRYCRIVAADICQKIRTVYDSIPASERPSGYQYRVTGSWAM